MAVLSHPDAPSPVTLRAQTLVGRSRSCDLQLDAPVVSGQHALIRWTEKGWELRDLGSRNGTFLGGRRLEPGERVTLKKGEHIGFGEAEPGWRLSSDSPPVAKATCGALEQVSEGGMIALPPGAEDPDVILYWAGDVGWVAERAGATEPAGEAVDVAGALWRLDLPAPAESTFEAQAPSVQTLALRFAVSWDEETTHAAMVFRGQETPLEDRAHHYLLLTLARQRLEDRAQGLNESEEGWVDQEALARGLRVPSPYVNLQVHRARRQLARLGVVDAARVVERRPHARQLRLGVRDLEVVRI
ncbi:MAG: FHA domain-containing protein [Alphaproteobacteria bacterium]|nr:FHA domain-containing protein [Alphaproteobacteria bacterium]